MPRNLISTSNGHRVWIVAAILLAASMSGAQPSFKLVDLGVIGGQGYEDSEGEYELPGSVGGLNDLGQIAGWTTDSSGRRKAFVWENGTFTILPAPASGDYEAWGINNQGQVIGLYQRSGSANFTWDGAVEWTGGSTVDLGNIYGSDLAEIRIGNGGTILAMAATEGYYGNLVQYSSGGWSDLRTASDPSVELGYNINSSGEIAMNSYYGSSTGWVLSNGAFQGLNNGGDLVRAVGTNDSGQVTGYYYDGSVATPYVFSDGVYTPLPTAQPNTANAGEQINNAGVVVGYDSSDGGLVEWANGVEIELQTYLNAASLTPSGWTFINNNGWIAGTAQDINGDQHGFLLQPGPSYTVNVLYDQSRSYKSGSTLPVKLQVLDSTGANDSSSSLVLHAVSVTLVAGNAPGILDDSGEANPDLDFRFDPTIGTGGGYIFNLSLKGYSTGTYNLNFTIGSDPTLYSVLFEVK